jgi:hypothetical protein
MFLVPEQHIFGLHLNVFHEIVEGVLPHGSSRGSGRTNVRPKRSSTRNSVYYREKVLEGVLQFRSAHLAEDYRSPERRPRANAQRGTASPDCQARWELAPVSVMLKGDQG